LSEHKQFQTIKGVRDILPPDSALWNRVEQTARAAFESFGFGEIRLPILEQTELFARAVGAETDVVSKEMFTFEDYEIPRLAQLRAAIDMWIGFGGQQEHLQLSGLFATFFAEAERAFIEGEIPRDSENESALRGVKEHRNRVQHLQPKNNEETQLQIQGSRAIVRRLKLGDSLTLRPEATASVCRAYIEHGMQMLPGDAKLYYIGPMFRRERPQKGRYRQFYQIGAEVLGSSDNPRIDADVLEMLTMFLDRLQLSGAKLYLNSIGHSAANCRPAYVEKLREALRAVKDQLGADSQRRIETNPLRVLDSKLPEEQKIIETLPRISDHLCAECRTHFAELQEQLKLRGIAYELSWRLVRGLDYYMRTTFEITATGLGSQDAICGGGRYDGLVELLGGPPTKGIGFAIGTDRLVLSLQEAAGTAIAAGKLDVFLVWFGVAAYPAAAKLARRLRSEGLRVELPTDEMKFKKSLSLADRLGARHAVIIGEDEVASGAFSVKKLTDGTQQKFKEEELVAYLRANRA
jgi:histidyl-tRNA synthetase